MNGHAEIQEGIAAYVLHALQPEERAALERDLVEHLPGCAECLALLRDLRELSGDLALAPGERPLSETAEASLMRRVSGTEQPHRIPRRRRALAVLVAAALSVAIGASATLNVVLSARTDRAERRAAEVAAAASVLADPSARTVALAGPRGRLDLAYLPSGSGVLLGRGIAAPPKGSVYELWLARDSRYVPVAVFSPDDGAVVLRFSVDPAEYAVAAVTIERRFVPQPTRAPVYSATIAA